ncbi:MAG: choice-of-anchor L domain-containing protein [Nannocystaceae bacterium]
MKSNSKVTAVAIAWTVALGWGCGSEDGGGIDETPPAEGDEGPDQGATTSAVGTSTGPGGGEVTAVTADGEPGSSSDDGAGPPPIKLDVGGVADVGTPACQAPIRTSCDNLDDDPWHALGLNCPGGPQANGVINLSGPEQLEVHQGNLGTFMPPPFPPREGDKFVILSSGTAADLPVPGLFASTSIDFLGGPLPPPLSTTPVSATDDCADDPSLIGTGDCSNTIEVQWAQGTGQAFDYAEMRMTLDVPAGVPAFSYDFAMFSTEYPVYYQSQFNDMYIAWLESELWTGNVSFDDMGNPISLNAGFLDYKDAPNPVDCPAPCVAPELQGTAMEGHAGTRWLTTTAGVVPGETIELIFAVFDLSDSALDTVMILDNFQWACEGGAPNTIPG